MRIAVSSTVAAILGFTMLLVLALLLPLPEGGREWNALNDFGHAPAFAILAALLMVGLMRRSERTPFLKAILLWIGVVGFGLLSEIVQGMVGRHPSWHDVRTDALGAAVGIMWMLRRSSDTNRWRRSLSVACGFLLLLAAIGPSMTFIDARRQRAEMPMLGSFEHTLELSRWAAMEAGIRRVREHATDGLWSLRIDLPRVMYPGANFDYPFPDWSDYEVFEMDVFLEGPAPMELIVRIEDSLHSNTPSADKPRDRFQRSLQLRSGMQRVSIDLSDIADAPQDRRMDLVRISRVQLFTQSPDELRTIFVDKMRLR